MRAQFLLIISSICIALPGCIVPDLTNLSATGQDPIYNLSTDVDASCGDGATACDAADAVDADVHADGDTADTAKDSATDASKADAPLDSSDAGTDVGIADAVEDGGSDTGIADVAADTDDSGPDVNDTGPDVSDTGPDVNDTGPDINDSGPDISDTGPDISDTGPDVAQPVPLATGQNTPTAIAVDGTYVYWTTATTVMKVPLIGGTPVQIDSAGGNGIAVSNAGVFGTSPGSGTIRMATLTDNAQSIVASGQFQPYGIAVDATNVYWANTDGPASDTMGNTICSVMKAPIGGNAPAPLAVNQYSGNTPQTVIVSDSTVYWFEGGNSPQICKVAISGGAVTCPFSAGLAGLALDATHLYYDGTSFLTQAPLIGGATVPIVVGTAVSIAVDGSNLYWTDGGSVNKASLAQYSTKTVIANGTGINGIAVDATSIYWTSASDGTVMKTAK